MTHSVDCAGGDHKNCTIDFCQCWCHNGKAGAMRKAIVFLMMFLPATVSFAKAPEVHFSPDAQNGKIIADFVTATKKKLVVAAYSLTSPEIAEALAREKAEGKLAGLVCDKANFKKKNEFCRKLGGKPDKKHGLMHNKFMVRDDSCVLTGSFNFTNNAIKNNRENFIIICNKKIAKQYSEQFQKIEENNT